MTYISVRKAQALANILVRFYGFVVQAIGHVPDTRTDNIPDEEPDLLAQFEAGFEGTVLAATPDGVEKDDVVNVHLQMYGRPFSATRLWDLIGPYGGQDALSHVWALIDSRLEHKGSDWPKTVGDATAQALNRQGGYVLQLPGVPQTPEDVMRLATHPLGS